MLAVIKTLAAKAASVLRVSAALLLALLLAATLYVLSYAVANSLSARGVFRPSTVDRFYKPLPDFLKHAVVLKLWKKVDTKVRSVSHQEATLSSGIEHVRYGFRDNTLLYVIFESTYTELRYPADVRPMAGGFDYVPGQWIDLPDGTRRDLPNSRMIFQRRLGEFTKQPLDVTLDQFKSFLASRPKQYSIETLEGYVRK